MKAQSIATQLQNSLLLLIGRRLVEGVGALHSLGFVHSDIKPLNVLLRRTVLPEIVLCDFGGARQIGSE
jgi:serine/threonine protein kinase